jgi:uncharacterized protein YkwD
VKKRILTIILGAIVIIAAIASTIVLHGASVAFTTKQPDASQSTNGSSLAIQRQRSGTPSATQKPTQAPQTTAPTPTPQVTPPTPTPPPNTGGTGNSSGSTSTENQLAQQLFNQINSDRAAQGLPAYSWNATLARGAYQHNVTMTTTGCGLAHQCPNEPAPCQRVTNEGITWMACGENIGYTSPYPDAWTAIKQNIEGGMLAEKPPDDGHRQNLLSTSFHHIGVAVLIDAKGLAWVTEDFTN